MNLFVTILLEFTTALAVGQQSAHKETLPNDPKAFVQSLYTHVVARHPYSILFDANERKTFDPYLSISVLHKIELARACSKDWSRQYGQAIKAPFAWSDFGIFSGANERDSPGSFRIEKMQAAGDGSFRVTVRLTYMPNDGPGSWRVVAVVIQEDGHLALNDVIYLKDPDMSEDTNTQMSKLLVEGCDGSHWIGYGKK